MQVTELLKQKGHDVATIGPDATIAVAIEMLRQWNVGSLVVSTDGTTIEGILSERDIVRGLGGPDRTLLDQLVSSVMSTEAITCAPTDRLEKLMALMTNKRIRHLPVEADGKLLGLVSIGDVVKVRLSELEADARVLDDYIHQGH
ncbi:MAG: CBS domain-containing protein [Actinomycetia bacterium]|nr:CBS domain-containing protein [Actinomycetes bacterium]MCP4225862.1 CBS domain-containing protein [Actinomycetes bacterium]MCP5033560.1 CBS domain-containing protein [Actinomycetes bacterium]